MQWVDADQLRRLLDVPYLVDGLRELHRAPPPAVDRALLEQPGGPAGPNHYLLLPAWQAGQALGAKLVTVFPGNERAGTGLPNIQAVYVLFDGAKGAPLAVIDGTMLTYLKTAADSALGATLLARDDPDRLLMVGAGALAPYLMEAHLAVRPTIRQVSVWNRTAASAQRLAETVSFDGVTVTAIADLEPAARAADVICCATASRAPLIEGAWLKPGAHLDLVGGFTNAMREADDEAARRARVYVDSRWFTLGHCGDITGPLDAGAITEADILGDLFELSRGAAHGRSNPDDITLFKNGGGAHLDLMTAQLAMRRLSENSDGSDR